MRLWWRSPFFWVVAGAIAFFVFYSCVLVFRHLNYYTAHYDLGNMDQVMWNALHGRWFQMVDAGNGSLISRFTYHADPLLLIYVPFYLLAPHPITLTIMQLLFVASAALPLFWFGRRLLPSWVAAIMAGGYLLYPPMIWNILFDVHAVTLVIPLVIWAAWAIVARRWWVYILTIGLLPFAKEQVGLTMLLLGLVVAWKVRPRWIGLATSAYGIAISLLMLFVVIPGVRHSPDHFFLKQYSAYGTTTLEVAKNIVTHPGQVLSTMTNAASRGYAYHMLGPLVGLPLLALPYVLVAGPEFAINTLSSTDVMHLIVFQYTSVLIPLLMLSAIIGMARWWRWTPRWKWVRMSSVVAFAGSALFFAWHDAPFPYSRHDVLNVFHPSPYRHSIAQIKKSILPSESVSVTNILAPQFTRRDHVWGFPVALDRTDVIVAMVLDADSSNEAVRSRAEIATLKKSPEWKVVLEDRELIFLRRVQK